MWLKRVIHREDEECLLHFPTSSISINSDFIVTSKHGWKFLPRLLLNTLFQLLMFTVPSFLRRASSSPTRLEKSLSPALNIQKCSTEYLDGVRGFASFIVFILHWTHLQYPGINSGYILGTDDASLWQLPFIRLIYSDAAMISIFLWCPDMFSHAGSFKDASLGIREPLRRLELTHLSSCCSTLLSSSRFVYDGIYHCFI